MNNYDDTRRIYCKEVATVDGDEFKNKLILDVGCGADGFMVKTIAKEYDISYIYGIDSEIKQTEKGNKYEIRKGDARLLDFEDNTFDLVFSISTFEHIRGIQDTISEIKRVLKPYGKAYINFAPLWTSVCGHHSYNMTNAMTDEGIRNIGKIYYDEKIVWSVPAWGHLYMSEDEMREHLVKEKYQSNKIDVLVDDIYHNQFINRVRAFDIRNMIINSGMIVRNYYEGVTFSRAWALDEKGESELTPEIAKKLMDKGYSVDEVGIVFMKAVLEKYESSMFVK